MANILNEIQEIYNKHYKECHYIIYSVILLIFFVLVLNNPHFYEFNKDEIHAWNIATNLNIIEIIKLMRAEGHGIIWYLMLKPFTLKPDLFFPGIIKWLTPFIKYNPFWFTSNDLLNEKLGCIHENIPPKSTVFGSMYSIGHEYPYLKNDYNFKTYNNKIFNSFESYFNIYNFSEEKIDIKELKRINTNNKFLMVNINFAEDIKLPKNFAKNVIKCTNVFIMKLD